MTTLFYSHPDFLKHDTGLGHPESSERLQSIQQAISTAKLNPLKRIQAKITEKTQQQIRLVHSQAHIDKVLQKIPADEFLFLDDDTIASTGSANAALLAVAAACDAVDKICTQQADNAFCASRPPGHHAEANKVQGFCLFNNIAIAAEYARQHYGIKRIAIVDFDVHHGNGTQAVFYQQKAVQYLSSHEMPNYPGTGYPTETGVGNIVNVPLAPETTGKVFREKYQNIILPALRAFKPELLLVSAGFDAHRDDPLSTIQLLEADYAWLGTELIKIAKEYSQGRLISVLEGGYHLEALANSVVSYLQAIK